MSVQVFLFVRDNKLLKQPIPIKIEPSINIGEAPYYHHHLICIEFMKVIEVQVRNAEFV